MTPSELHKIFIKLGIYMSKEDSDRIFEHFDSDRSGSIDPEGLPLGSCAVILQRKSKPPVALLNTKHPIQN